MGTATVEMHKGANGGPKAAQHIEAPHKVHEVLKVPRPAAWTTDNAGLTLKVDVPWMEDSTVLGHCGVLGQLAQQFLTWDQELI